MTDSPEMQALKQRMKATWMSGDFGQIARISALSGEEFVARLNLEPGTRVLDVACGTGNQSIPAARTGAEVTGLDLCSNLLEQARDRARAENLQVEFVEGDAEQLPQKDRSFDVVLSMFGAMFAPRPERVVSELLRVCKPGGLIAMGNWTPQGFVGKSFQVSSRHASPPPNVPPPVLWGEENVVRDRFGDRAKLTFARRNVKFDLDHGPADVVQFFRNYFGPTKVAFDRLDSDGQKRFQDDLVRLWMDHNESKEHGRTVVHGEYLEVHARPN